MSSLGEIKDTAAKWVALRESETWTPEDEAELTQWTNASTANLFAFVRAEAAWREADRLKVLGAGFPRGMVPSMEELRGSPFFKHLKREMPGLSVSALRERSACEASKAASFEAGTAALTRKPIFRAAAAAVLLVFAVLTWKWVLFADNVYSTPRGVTAAVPLPDGSQVTLNTDSEIRVSVTAKERSVKLEHGEAFFEIVHDPLRPFTVSAGDKRIVVLGTKFSVRRDRQEVQVLVTEGAVRIEDSFSGAARTPSGSADFGLPAGSLAWAKEGSPNLEVHTVTAAEELLSWRSGYLVFHETPLADAVAEFNRYNTRTFVIQDPAVAAIRVSGNFRYSNVESFARLLAGGFPVMVDHQGDRIVLRQAQGR